MGEDRGLPWPNLVFLVKEFGFSSEDCSPFKAKWWYVIACINNHIQRLLILLLSKLKILDEQNALISSIKEALSLSKLVDVGSCHDRILTYCSACHSVAFQRPKKLLHNLSCNQWSIRSIVVAIFAQRLCLMHISFLLFLIFIYVSFLLVLEFLKLISFLQVLKFLK